MCSGVRSHKIHAPLARRSTWFHLRQFFISNLSLLSLVHRSIPYYVENKTKSGRWHGQNHPQPEFINTLEPGIARKKWHSEDSLQMIKRQLERETQALGVPTAKEVPGRKKVVRRAIC
jgi:hypothetical protein